MRKESSKRFLARIFIFCLIIIPLIFLIICAISCKTGQTKTSIDFPEPKGYINDYTDTLSENWINKTEQFVQDVEKETSSDIAVSVIDDLGGYSIEEFAAGLFKYWGVGKKDKNNGVLLLVALNERELRIEVGYGLEGVITDLQAKEIIDEVIVPRFRNNDYESGIYNGVIALANRIYLDQGMEQLQYTDDIKAAPKKSFTQSGWFIAIIIISVLMPCVLFGAISGSLYLKRYIKEHKCPKCKKIGLIIKYKILVSPTYDAPGRQEVEKYCKFCDFREKSTHTLSRLSRSSDSVSSSGDFSSSSNSSSSSSSSGGSSSFGGGSSGGGVASGSW